MNGGANGDVAVPPTLQALIAARLDQLESSERRVLECAAVEGEVFHRGAVRALSPGEPQVPRRLLALVRKQLIRRDKAQFRGDDAFRFRHLLIRDAAYDGLAKATRAELHERFANWFQQRGSDLGELDEVLGHHLEQAARYKQELGQPDRELAERAGERLAAGGRRALWREDRPAAVALLVRALEQVRPLRLDVGLELDLAEAYGLRDERQAAEIADAAARQARDAGDHAGVAAASVVAAAFRSQFAHDPAVDELEELALEALAVLERAEDHAGLIRAWRALNTVAGFRGHLEDQTRAWEEALRHARLEGRPHSHLSGIDSSLALGPRPADEALWTLDAVFPDSLDPPVLLERAVILAMLTRFEEAWPLARVASERLRELYGEYRRDVDLAEIAVLAGDHASAVLYLRRQCKLFEERGLRNLLSTYAPLLGHSLCARGRYEEAEPLARLGRELGDEQDVATQMIWRQVQALVHASRGEYADAEPLAHEAVALTERTDSPNWQGDALCDLAEVLAAAGRTDEAVEALEQALDRYERKKNLAMVAQVRPKLDSLRLKMLT